MKGVKSTNMGEEQARRFLSFSPHSRTIQDIVVLVAVIIAVGIVCDNNIIAIIASLKKATTGNNGSGAD